MPVKTAAEIAFDLRDSGSIEQFERFSLALPGTRDLFAVFDGIPADELNSDAHAKALAAKLMGRLVESGDIRSFLSCIGSHSVPDIAKDKQSWLKTVVENTPGVHDTAIRALAMANIDRELLDIPIKDRIEQYFDGLLKTKNNVLNGISPFEVGAVLELSGKYRLMQQYYEMVLKARDRNTDRAIVEPAQERLIFAQAGLAIANDAAVRRRIESQYKKSARDWSVSLGQLPLTINLHSYREAIERFYEDRHDRTTTLTTKSAPEVHVVQRVDDAVILKAEESPAPDETTCCSAWIQSPRSS